MEVVCFKGSVREICGKGNMDNCYEKRVNVEERMNLRRSLTVEK